MKVYFDNAATTKLIDEVYEVMLPYLKDQYYNPSSLYQEAQNVRNDINGARLSIANLLNTNENNIIFTGSGSEASNMAIKGAAYLNQLKGKHLITTEIEHHAVLESFKWLEEQGFEVTYLPVNERGVVEPETIEQAIRPDTTLLSVMWVNNETGACNDISTIIDIKNRKDILFHTDAVQALKTENIDLSKMDIDLLSISAHKIHGPKGVGALYVKQLELPSLIHGGQQEFGRRAGTESVASIIGFGKAAEILANECTSINKHLIEIKNRFIQGIREIAGTVVIGDSEHSSPSIVNVGFKGVQAEHLLIHLSHKGICASMGAACNSRTIEPSYVLRAMNVDKEYVEGCIRCSFSRFNTLEEVDYVIEELKKILLKLRK